MVSSRETTLDQPSGCGKVGNTRPKTSDRDPETVKDDGEVPTERINQVPLPIGVALYKVFVPGKIENHQLPFQIHTGSSETLMDTKENNLMDPGTRPTLTPVGGVIRQADGKPLAVRGSAQMKVQIGGYNTQVEVLVASIRNQWILRMNFLLTTGCVLDSEHQRLKIGKHEVPLQGRDQTNTFCYRV